MNKSEYDILEEYGYLNPAIVKTDSHYIATSTLSKDTFRIDKKGVGEYHVYVRQKKNRWKRLGCVANVMSIFALINDYDDYWLKKHKPKD